ncbi:MAG: hypothetical protein J5863_02585 [Desulfovibrio sp.]|nr:hypothetical protein [Desulfovibrio sp.]
MKRSPSPVYGALVLSVAALAFCVWVKTGNSFDICFTEGCTLYADASFAGISLWWFGALAFGLLALLALLRHAGLGHLLAGLCVAADICLLALMAFTAPCFNCLVAAGFFLAVYLSFRRACQPAQTISSRGQGRSLLALLWTLFFLFNAGAVLKSFAGVWAVNENLEHAKVHFYFSPSCPSCRKGVEALAGKVDVAFLPVAESSRDLARIRIMARELHSGSNILEALAKSEAASEPGLLDYLDRDMLAVKFRVLRNQAHVFHAGSQVVPFVEYQGLPGHLAKAAEASSAARRPYQRVPQAAVQPQAATAAASPAKPAGQPSVQPQAPQISQTPQAGQAGQPGQSSQAGPAPRRPQASQGGDPSLPFGEGDSGSVAGACRHNAACDDEPDAFGQGQGGAFQRRRP